MGPNDGLVFGYEKGNGAHAKFCVTSLMAGSYQYSQRKRNGRKQRTDRSPAGGLKSLKT
jgi:hypothetical protein